MSTHASHELAVDMIERTELTWTIDLHGQDPADLTIYTMGDLTAPAMTVGELYRDDVQRIIDKLTADLHLVPERP